MKKLFKPRICLKSMFSKLVASFILVIVLISSFHLITNFIYTQNMKNEITENVGERFDSTVNEFELYFNEIKDKLLLGFYIENQNYLKPTEVNSYQGAVMFKSMSKYLLMHKYIQDIVVIIKDFDYIISLNGTLEQKNFFDKMYTSEYYTQNFWNEEIKKDFMYKIYPDKKFQVYDSIGSKKYQDLIPIALKNNYNNNFLIITLIDINKFTNELTPDFTKDFYIFNNNGELIYPLEGDCSNKIISEITRQDQIPAYWEFDNGYIFTKKSSDNSLIYCKYYPNTIVKKQLNDSNKILTLIILISMLVSIALSVYIVKKFNNPVKQIYQLIKESKEESDSGTDIIDLKNIKDNIAGIVSENTNYAKDIDEKNSMLKSYFYQDRLKNILLKADDPGNISTEFGNYAVILIKIHYRDMYYNEISVRTSLGSSVLKDLIHVYITELHSNAVTFQIEHDQIVSIVNVDKGAETIKDDIEKIVRKLSTEDDYVYFTVAYSRVYSNSSDLHEAYEKVMEIQRCRKFVKRTQILSENILGKKLDGFYFNEEQQKQFSNLLQSGKKDECIQQIDRAFDYNVKKEVNEFSMYLLYVQVIDCCSNVLVRLYNEIPEKLSLINDYFCFGLCESVEDYRKRYLNVITECADYIVKNQKQSDYIIEYVKNYISGNYASDISIDLLADKLNISRTYLSRYFKNNTGINLSDYLNAYRMNKACALLQNSFLMVKDIAPKVGIYSISTFIRLFKNYTGKTPNDYRKSNIQ